MATSGAASDEKIVNEKVSIGSGNGLALSRRQAITWNYVDGLDIYCII